MCVPITARPLQKSFLRPCQTYNPSVGSGQVWVGVGWDGNEVENTHFILHRIYKNVITIQLLRSIRLPTFQLFTNSKMMVINWHCTLQY